MLLMLRDAAFQPSKSMPAGRMKNPASVESILNSGTDMFIGMFLHRALNDVHRIRGVLTIVNGP
jgi:hypothetical protein